LGSRNLVNLLIGTSGVGHVGFQYFVLVLLLLLLLKYVEYGGHFEILDGGHHGTFWRWVLIDKLYRKKLHTVYPMLYKPTLKNSRN